MSINSKEFMALQPGVNQLGEQRFKSQHDPIIEKLRSALTAKRGQEAMVANQKAANDFAKAQGLGRGKFSVNVSESGMAVNPESEAAGAAMREKYTDNSRLETKALQDEYNKLVGKRRDNSKSITDIENLINSDSAMGQGQLGAALSRLSGEVGVLTDQDIARVMPKSAKQDLTKLWNYFTGQSEPGLTQAQKAAAIQLLQNKRTAIDTDLNSVGQEVQTRAPYLAPSLHQTGALPKVLQGLGVASKSPGQSPPPEAGGMIRVRDKKSGQSGTLPAGEFDPNLYERL
jgi:hypothetical protein